MADLDAALAQYAKLGVTLAACLVDASVAGAYGGTGHVAPWELLAHEWPLRPRPPMVLAGGLTAANVGAAVRVVRPWGVDVASGVEAAPGVKDPRLVRAFLEKARTSS